MTFQDPSADVLAKYDVPLASNQVEFSLLRQLPQTSGLLAEMKKRKYRFACLYAFPQTRQIALKLITFCQTRPWRWGRLTGKYTASNPIPKKRQ